MSKIRMALAMAAFCVLFGVAGSARADVTITGTVGEVSAGNWQAGPNQTTQNWVRFKLTDLNQTKTCTGGAFSNIGSGYAIFGAGGLYREWFAMLLVSKKGATIVCSLTDSVNCVVNYCTLP